MKTKQWLQIVLVVAGALLFNWFFWQETWGINVLLFNVFITGTLIFLNFARFKNKNVILALLCTYLSAFSIVLYSSVVSFIAWPATLIVLIALLYQTELRSVLSAFPTGLFNLAVGPIRMFGRITKTNSKGTRKSRKHGTAMVVVIPLAILLVFYAIFLVANPVFNEINANFFTSLGEILAAFFEKISWIRILFVILGLIVCAGLIVDAGIGFIAKRESLLSTILSRRLIKQNQYRGRTFKKRGLLVEYKLVLVLLLMINILVAVINVIDINWIWLNFQLQEGMDLKQLVHEGTYFLILSILLSMGLVLYYFRGNLNYIRNAKWIRIGAYAWMIQNIVMVISVFIRNYHYYHYYGLAYKRIGVAIFLILVIIGIFTVLVKIRNRKTNYYLWKNNSIAAYIVLITMSFINWDGIIAKNNLAHKFPENIEADFLLSLSDKTLQIIDADRAKFITNQYLKNEDSIQKLDQRIFDFRLKQQQRTWLSWNFAENRTEDYFNLKNQ